MCQTFFEQGFQYIITSGYMFGLVYLGIENLCKVYEVEESVGSTLVSILARSHIRSQQDKIGSLSDKIYVIISVLSFID